MKKQSNAIYNNISHQKSLSSVKVEPVFETRGYNESKRQINGYYRSNRGQNNTDCGSQGRGRLGRCEANQNAHGSGDSINNEVRKRKLANAYDKVTCYSTCDSIYHWAKGCPHKE